MLKSILEELVINASILGSTYEDSVMSEKSYEKTFSELIAHAKSEIEKLIEGIVPKEKPEPIREGSWSVTDEDIYHTGWNACREEMIRRMK